jgi:hypothetical protein
MLSQQQMKERKDGLPIHPGIEAHRNVKVVVSEITSTKTVLRMNANIVMKWVILLLTAQISKTKEPIVKIATKLTTCSKTALRTCVLVVSKWDILKLIVL